MAQNDLNVPTVGPDSPTNFAGQINSALVSLASKNSGGFNPNNYPTLSIGGNVTGQDWWDTSVGGASANYRIFDGTLYVALGQMDGTNHVWLPKVGGGYGSISGAAGGGVDIGSVPQYVMTLTGTTVGHPITSFGNNAALQIGESKIIIPTAAGILQNTASIQLAAGVNVTFSSGDVFHFVYLGGGVWQETNYQSNTSSATLFAVVSQTSGYAVSTSHNTQVHVLSGGPFTITVAAPAGFASGFWLKWINKSTTRGCLIAISGLGGSTFYIYPGQTITLTQSAGRWMIDPASTTRWPNGALTVFADSVNGSDSNDGLAAGSGNAFLTLTQALLFIQRYVDSSNGPPTIQLADGTYTVSAGLAMNYGVTGCSQMYITGNTSTPANVIISCSPGSSCFIARDGGMTVTFNGMTLSTTGNSSSLLSCSQMAVMDFGTVAAVNFNAAPLGNHMLCTTWASINVLGPYTVNGGANSHINCSNTAYMNYGSYTVTGAASLSFAGSFAVATDCGIINAGGLAMSFSGFASVSGKKYSSSQNAVIDSAGTVYPGSIAGTTGTGGLYS
jgi:hypothetical protein